MSPLLGLPILNVSLVCRWILDYCWQFPFSRVLLPLFNIFVLMHFEKKFLSCPKHKQSPGFERNLKPSFVSSASSLYVYIYLYTQYIYIYHVCISI